MLADSRLARRKMAVLFCLFIIRPDYYNLNDVLKYIRKKSNTKNNKKIDEIDHKKNPMVFYIPFQNCVVQCYVEIVLVLFTKTKFLLLIPSVLLVAFS